MRRTSGARRWHLAQSGFTRVELLVTIVVLGILGAVTVVAIQKSKLTAHRDDCAVKMVQLAKATFQYELGRREYPGYLNRWPRDDGSPYINPATGKQQGVIRIPKNNGARGVARFRRSR